PRHLLDGSITVEPRRSVDLLHLSIFGHLLLRKPGVDAAPRPHVPRWRKDVLMRWHVGVEVVRRDALWWAWQRLRFHTKLDAFGDGGLHKLGRKPIVVDCYIARSPIGSEPSSPSRVSSSAPLRTACNRASSSLALRRAFSAS